MPDDDLLKQLLEDLEVLKFRGDLALENRMDYSSEEMEDIIFDMSLLIGQAGQAMQARFAQLPPEGQQLMLDMLTAQGTYPREFWERFFL